MQVHVTQRLGTIIAYLLFMIIGKGDGGIK